jgi:hypothetical protein
MQKMFFIGILAVSMMACQGKYPGVPSEYHVLLDEALLKADSNLVEMEKALELSPANQKEGMAFLISYMPERDLTTLSADFLLENALYAYKAREEFPWCKALPDSVFFNEVLPYANISEDRDPWRKDFYERFKKYAEGKDNMVDALFAINRPINKEVGVEYNTKRSRQDASPTQSMAEGMATCTGLSIILTDAFRSVGIPSRLAGTAMWTNLKGNHTWSEVWIDGTWKFIEYYPDTLDRSWFVADAGKADPENPIHWIYAVSYKPTGTLFPAAGQFRNMVMDLDTTLLPPSWRKMAKRMKESGVKPEEGYIHGLNVTQRYIDIYRHSSENNPLKENELMVDIIVYKSPDSQTSNDRVSCRVEVHQGDQRVDFGYSPTKTEDNNKFLKFRLLKDQEYSLVLVDPSIEGQQKTIGFNTADYTNGEVLKLSLR